jgi:23S rRNA pseudouridine1911/1915/1917 synthase
MIFAKSEAVKTTLQKNWNDSVLERTYLAVVEGAVKQTTGTVVSYLKESPAFVMYSCQDHTEGQKAITHYKVLKQNAQYTLLKVNLETGRKNQIRVHMQDMGHSVIGDKKYGSTVNPIGRLGLHAQVLAFTHPVSGKPMRFETQIPKAFLKLF